MGWLDLKPITVAELLELATVPVSLWISWKIFESGKSNEQVKIKNQYIIDYCTKLKNVIESIDKDIINYYFNTPKEEAEQKACMINLNSRIDNLQKKLPKLASLSGEAPDYFFASFLDYKGALTGAHSGFAASKLKPRPITDPLYATIKSKKESLQLTIDRIIEKHLK